MVAKGTNTASSSSDQPMVAVMGCWSGQLACAAAAPGLPNSCRQAATSALTGLQSAIVRSQPGIPVVGTKLLEIMVTGKASGRNASTVSGRMLRPMNTPPQLSAYRSSVISPNAAAALAIPSRARHPTSRPIVAMIANPIVPVRRSARVRPNGTAERAIGMDLNRSTTPSATSLETIRALGSRPMTEVIANSPGIRYSR